MPEVLDWRNAADPRAVIHRAVEALTEGRVVGFPTDTIYTLAASALIPQAVERIDKGGAGSAGPTLAIGVRSAGEALDWIPDMSAMGRRLAGRCWPGPVTLQFEGVSVGGLGDRLPASVREKVAPDSLVRLRSPAHQALLASMQLLPGPLVLAEATGAECEMLTTPQAASVHWGDRVDVLLDDGQCSSPRPSTVVGIQGSKWQLIRPGVITEDVLRRSIAYLVLFVCTGNTCRSPLAEALCKRRLAERLGCREEDLPERGFHIASAGVAAHLGDTAADEAIRAVAAYGADLRAHVSRPLSAEMAAHADFLVAMTRGHLRVIRESFPSLAATPRLLSPVGLDIADPIGGNAEIYQACAAQVWESLDPLIEELLHA